MANAKTKLEREEISARLIQAPREQQVLFAARCALRALPLLGNCGEDFRFWKNEQQAKHLVNVLRAINAAYATAASDAIDTATVYATATATAASDAASDAYAHEVAAKPNARDAYAAAHVAHTATALHEASTAAAAAAYAAATYVVAAYDAAAHALHNAVRYDADAAAAARNDATDISADLTNIDSTPLWRSGQPTKLVSYERDLISGMERLGLHYWVRQYRGWTKGEFDWPQMRRCLEMPEEFTHSAEAMMDYLEAAEQGKQSHLDEARVLIIGEGEVGKTSLLNYLLDSKLAEPGEPSTPGVKVRENEEHIGKRKLRVHYWDFGGQLHLHPTHQFFMRSRCVYLVVVNARTENACSPQVEYWLEHVRIFGRSAPTLIVQNKVDESPGFMDAKPPFDMLAIKKQFPFVRGNCLNLSCKNGTGRKQLQQEIKALLSEHRILDELTPTTWFDVKERLRAEQGHYINRKRYYELCELSGVAKVDSKRGALDALDQLGVALHFPEVDDDLFVLKPEWVTDIVYHIINKSASEHWNGKLNADRLQVIFDRNKYPNAPEVRPDKLRAVLRLLQQFELVYDIGNEDYRAPMLLDNESKAEDFPMDHRLKFTVTMPALLPPALYFRFITQCGKAREIDGDKLWRRGCVLARGDVRVLVEYLINERRISLTVYGEKQPAGQYLSALRLRLFELCGKFEGMEYEAKVSGPEFDSVPFVSLLASVQNNIPTMVDGKGKTVTVMDIAHQLFGVPPTVEMVLPELVLLHIENRVLHKALERPITITNNNYINNNTDVNVSHTLSLNLQITAQLQKIDNALDPSHFKSLGDRPALLKDIESLRNTIAEFGTSKEEDKRKGILPTIKRYAKNVQDGLKGITGFAELAETMRTAVDALSGLML